jgi:heptosyltransferase-2
VRSAVLVYMPDRGVGDLMWHLPTIRAIASKAPDGKVVLATRPSTRAAAVLCAEPSVSSVEYLDYRTGALKRWDEFADFYRLCRRVRPRAVWILEKIGRPANAAALAGVPERYGFGLGHASQERWLSRGPRLPKVLRPAHRIEKLAAFEALHGLTVDSREPALRVEQKRAEAIEARFAGRPKPWVVLGAGSVDAHRRWPLERFAEVTQILAGEVGTIFWFGGGAEEEARFAAAAPNLANVVVSCDLPLDEGAALISRAEVFVGNDSGPMNLAAAVGVPSLGLYGSSAPLSYSKWLTPLVSPTPDLADLTSERVLAAIRSLRPAAVRVGEA